MQSLMSYGSSSVGSEESSPRKKKLKRIEHEESEVSSSVVEGDHSGLKARVTTESIESPAMKLLEMGCSSEQVAHAIRVCGRNTPVADVLDFIQAHQYHTVDIDGATNVPDPEDLERQLIEMGFLPEHIARALKACGKKSSIFEIADYIQAHYCVEDPSCSERNEVGRFGSGDQDGDGAATTLQRLLQMGFTPAVVQRASEERNSIDFDVLLEYLLDNKEGDLPTTLEPVRTEIKHPRAGFLKKMSTNSKAADEAGSSRKVSSAGKWTEDEVKLWYTYIGSKKKSTRFSESDGSDSETPGAAWEGKSGLKIKRGSKKICVLQSQREDISGPLSPGKMMGFGTPGHFIGRPRPLPNLMQGPPYFYFENVASVPKSEWDTIKLHFDGVDPEFTDSKFFSASRRPRGYVHNLPVEGRKLILPTPPMTIFEALPHTRKYWPCWDTRDKLNCINTRRASDSLCDRSRKLFTMYKGLEIPYDEQQNILQEFKKWNLVWVGPGQPAPLEPHEIELLLGFDLDHTRGCSTMTDRYEVLGNSFQVNTVAYHLSPLKSLYPQGITVLSLFSGIGGAEVALHKLGVFLKTVVAVEKNVKTRDTITSWWRKSGQRGDLILKDDVRELTNEVLSGLIDEIGSIDLIIGGSPCNNLSRNNRNSQVGLSGTDSSLFFEFPRILNIVKRIMGERGYMPKLF